MFIITVLCVTTNEIEIIDCFNDELHCQNEYLNKISELSNRNDEATSSNDNNNNSPPDNISYEPIFIQKNKCYIYKKNLGWISNSKVLDKIVVLHSLPIYNITDAE